MKRILTFIEGNGIAGSAMRIEAFVQGSETAGGLATSPTENIGTPHPDSVSTAVLRRAMADMYQQRRDEMGGYHLRSGTSGMGEAMTDNVS